MAGPGEVTELLQQWGGGDPSAANALFPLVYDELRRIARSQLRSKHPSETLGATALVHETYLKLVDQTRVSASDRHHFFALAARAMRQILVDHARRRGAAKRGGGRTPSELVETVGLVEPREGDILALDSALARLEELDPRLSRLVEVRFFGGLSVEEAADALEMSPRTVKRDWQKARAFLYQELESP
jgi:RNA polymerase sigma factor (TIGR02999 family)